MEIETIFKKLKNKKDFKSAVIETSEHIIFIKLNKIYFETQNKYNLIIEELKTSKRQSYFNLNKIEIIEKLKNYKILNFHI